MDAVLSMVSRQAETMDTAPARRALQEVQMEHSGGLLGLLRVVWRGRWLGWLPSTTLAYKPEKSCTVDTPSIARPFENALHWRCSPPGRRVTPAYP